VGGAQHAIFGRPVERNRTPALDLALARRVASQDQLHVRAVEKRVEAPGLARRAARQAPQILDRDGSAEIALAGLCQRRGDGLRFLIGGMNDHSADCGTAPRAW